MSRGPKRLSVGWGLQRGEWCYVQRILLPPIPMLQFFQGAQLSGTGLSSTVDTRAVVKDLGPTLPGVSQSHSWS